MCIICDTRNEYNNKNILKIGKLDGLLNNHPEGIGGKEHKRYMTLWVGSVSDVKFCKIHSLNNNKLNYII